MNDVSDDAVNLAEHTEAVNRIAEGWDDPRHRDQPSESGTAENLDLIKRVVVYQYQLANGEVFYDLEAAIKRIKEQEIERYLSSVDIMQDYSDPERKHIAGILSHLDIHAIARFLDTVEERVRDTCRIS